MARSSVCIFLYPSCSSVRDPILLSCPRASSKTFRIFHLVSKPAVIAQATPREPHSKPKTDTRCPTVPEIAAAEAEVEAPWLILWMVDHSSSAVALTATPVQKGSWAWILWLLDATASVSSEQVSLWAGAQAHVSRRFPIPPWSLLYFVISLFTLLLGSD